MVGVGLTLTAGEGREPIMVGVGFLASIQAQSEETAP